jgi:hypothetical protein
MKLRTETFIRDPYNNIEHTNKQHNTYYIVYIALSVMTLDAECSIFYRLVECRNAEYRYANCCYADLRVFLFLCRVPLC